MRFAVVIAALNGKVAGQRARAAYLRESPRGAEIIAMPGRDLGHAWKNGFHELRGAESFDLIHFAADWLEPHPGWWKAARADGRALAAPSIWEPDGTPPEELRDWTPSPACLFPTMTPQQIASYGLPPFGVHSRAEFVIRTQYAFTTWQT